MTIELAVLVGAALALIALGLLPRRRSRQRILAAPVPAWWRQSLNDMLPYFRQLDGREQQDFVERTQVFLSDQRIQPVECEPDEADLLFLAATAVMMSTGFDGFRYPNHRDILIYPQPFDEEFSFRDDGDRLGEMTEGGPIIFALPALREAQYYDDAIDVAVHELAHVLDALMSSDSEHFRSELDPEVDAFLADASLVRAIENEESPIDDYALENEAEFFAVCSELFFHDPAVLLEYHPAIYQWLRAIYNQEPLRRA